MMGTRGMVFVTPISAYKGCFFVDSARRAEWFQEQGRISVRGWSILLRRWSPSENKFVFGKFRRGWLELKGLPFHLWDEEQLKFILKKWGRVTKAAKESLKFADLTKVKLWVEMCPNVVLPALLEVEDGAWTFTVAVSVTGDVKDDNITPESDRCRDGLVNMGGYVSQWSKNAERLRGRDNEYYSRRPLPQPHNRSKLASKREFSRGGRQLGSEEGNFIGLTAFEPLNKTQTEKAQSGKILCGPQDEPSDSQAQLPSSSSRQQGGSSAKAILQSSSSSDPVIGRAGVAVLSGEGGRAFEIKAQSPPILGPPSDEVAGCVLKGPSRLGQILKGKKPSVEKDWPRREEDDAAARGKTPEGQSRGFLQKEESAVTKRMWTTLFPPSSDCQQERRRRSEPIIPAKPPSASEVRPMEEDVAAGSQSRRDDTATPLFRRLLRKRGSGEGTSTSRGNQRFEEDKDGSMGRVGSDLRGFTVTGSLSSPEIKGKGLVFEGFCEFPGMENSEVCMSSLSQPPKSSSTPHFPLSPPSSSPSGPDLLNSVHISQSPMENRVFSEFVVDKDVVGNFFQNFVGISVHDEVGKQIAIPNQMSECVTPCKPKPSMPKEVSNRGSGSQGDTVVSPSGEFHMDGLSPRKMAKVREVLNSLDIKAYSRRKNRSSTGN
ncbi:hypothetical protein PVL29_014651 [Vitis rotundifolia]|uniref:DUF4283 domain-containing protein n=1 Tax=Vitis rotundifolia TaxID=103349 RepID=A0AA39DP48_VITRO|nr:hypothetical protein PVL29_014651 [Vitis rotundifolia]